MSNSSGQPQSRAVALEYLVDGPRTIAAVAEGKSRLMGVGLVNPNGPARFVHEDIANTVRSFTGLHRVYDGAMFALVVEQILGIPRAESFDDVSVMRGLLHGSPTYHELSAGGWSAVRPDLSNDRERLLGEPANSVVAAALRLQGLRGPLMAQVVAEGLNYIYRKVELPVVQPTVAMSLVGIRANIQLLDELLEGYRTRLGIVRRRICEVAGELTRTPMMTFVSTSSTSWDFPLPSGLGLGPPQPATRL